MSPRVLVLRAPGANCDEETAYAFERAGAQAERVHVNRWLESPPLASKFQILCLPGGFSYGDDLGSGRILGNQLRNHLSESLADFRDAGKLVLGICNGFQILVKSGLLDSGDERGPGATLTWNNSGRFIDRWVHLQVSSDRSPFLAGIDRMTLPIAHAEGRFVVRDEMSLNRLELAGQIALRYCEGACTSPLPFNPNGAVRDLAGMCDQTGRVFGLMPHPERFIDRTQHPNWTRMEPFEKGDGLKVFCNAVKYFA